MAGFGQWQAKGRQVRKGEKGIKILEYSTKKITDEDDNGGETERLIRRFPILSVFDIGQTDPSEGTEQADTLTTHVKGEDTTGIADTVTDWLIGQGRTVSREPIGGAANGYTTTDGNKLAQRLIVGRGTRFGATPDHVCLVMGEAGLIIAVRFAVPSGLSIDALETLADPSRDGFDLLAGGQGHRRSRSDHPD